MPIRTTVIGSFPLPLKKDSCDKDLNIGIERVVDLQLECGIDIITDGEQRGPMIGYFEQIPGLERVKSGLKIVDKIMPMHPPEDFHKIVDFKKVRSYLDNIGREDVLIKVTITGPISLGVQCAVNGLNRENYKTIMDPEIYSDLSQALLPLAEKAINIGAHVQIDEPGLSGRFVSPAFAKRVLSDFSSSIATSVSSKLAEEMLSIHVCGSLARASGIYETLLELEFPVLSLAFSGKMERENMGVVSRESLEENGKKLGVGFISNIKLEDEATSLGRLIEIEKIVGLENIAYLHPDCGLASTPREIIRPILENMKKASDTFQSHF